MRNVMRVIDEHAPGFSSGIIDMQVLTPPDIEAKIWDAARPYFPAASCRSISCSWARPAPHWADYRTPIKGLYQCGSSAHPGGGVGGVVGYNAAREIHAGPPIMNAAGQQRIAGVAIAALLLASAMTRSSRLGLSRR